MTTTSANINSEDAVSILIRDHHHVKSAFKKFESLGERAFVSKKDLADEICSALIVHATIEDEIFYPAVRKLVQDGQVMVDEAIVEHASAKEIISQILAMSAEDHFFDAKVKVLSEQIAHHVEEEEKEMFVNARRSKLDLVTIGEKLVARKKQLEADMMDS